MTNPHEPTNDERALERRPLTQEDRRLVLRAASLRPVNLLMLVLGGFASVLFSWWFAPLTIVTYVLLVFLAARDPFFERQILGERGPLSASHPDSDISPERRARWLPRGETRRQVEAALEIYRKTVASIEESDDVARAVLADAVPKLHAAANRLVEVGTKREKAATIIADLQSLTNAREDHAANIEKLQDEICRADTEMSETYDQLVALHTKVAQVSISDTSESRAAAVQMSTSLDELNLRLEALEETLASHEEPSIRPEDQTGQSP